MKQKITWKDILIMLTLIVAPGGFFVLPAFVYAKIRAYRDSIQDD